ncbi:ankyrin repeat domain-containing protein 42-like [Penaeus japonicus]|uniref:ankyrin repeat domain-containing protein 42-like n=1 Tax=Penaeus japonicus TaxID=27405 RepID=UPI001C710AB0|nr:ankyrin repeat domain-containing protein 42-like [Penaeus japonicus]
MAMHLAAWNGHMAALEVLREGGADVDAADDGGDTPLHKATLRGHLYTMFTLMNFGASMYKKNKGGRTPQDLMRKSFSSGGMELFQSVSMTHVMQGWVATEKERIRLQREIKVLKDVQEEQGRERRRTETAVTNLQTENSKLKDTLCLRERELKDRLEGARKIRKLRAEVRDREEQLTQAEEQHSEELRNLRRIHRTREEEAEERELTQILGNLECIQKRLRDRKEGLKERESHLKQAERHLRKTRDLYSLSRDRDFDVEGSEELEAASAGQLSTSDPSLPLSLPTRRRRARGAARSDDPPQAAGRDEPPQAADFDEPLQEPDFDEPLQAADFDEPLQAADFDEPLQAADFDEPLQAADFDEHIARERKRQKKGN